MSGREVNDTEDVFADGVSPFLQLDKFFDGRQEPSVFLRKLRSVADSDNSSEGNSSSRTMAREALVYNQGLIRRTHVSMTPEQKERQLTMKKNKKQFERLIKAQDKYVPRVNAGSEFRASDFIDNEGCIKMSTRIRIPKRKISELTREFQNSSIKKNGVRSSSSSSKTILRKQQCVLQRLQNSYNDFRESGFRLNWRNKADSNDSMERTVLELKLVSDRKRMKK